MNIEFKRDIIKTVITNYFMNRFLADNNSDISIDCYNLTKFNNSHNITITKNNKNIESSEFYENLSDLEIKKILVKIIANSFPINKNASYRTEYYKIIYNMLYPNIDVSDINISTDQIELENDKLKKKITFMERQLNIIHNTVNTNI